MFCVKYRKDMFMEDKYLFALKSVLDEIAKRYFLKFETMGIDEDHVHMLLELAHKYSPSHLV
jgi:REP element-mobilizing transposase RayT